PPRVRQADVVVVRLEDVDRLGRYLLQVGRTALMWNGVQAGDPLDPPVSCPCCLTDRQLELLDGPGHVPEFQACEREPVNQAGVCRIIGGAQEESALEEVHSG